MKLRSLREWSALASILALPFPAVGAMIVSQNPVSGGGVPRWSQLWQDPGPGGNDLDSDAVCWEDFKLNSATTITHIEWWGTGACELGFQIEFWPQDTGTIAYQPLAVFDRGPGPSPVTPTARFIVTPADYTTNSGPGGLTHFILDLATPVSLAANDGANPRWFIGVIGLTHQAFVTWNWSQGLGGSTRTFQWLRADGNSFRSLSEGRALVLRDNAPDPPSPLRLSLFAQTYPALTITAPTGSVVQVESANDLASPSQWLPLTNLVIADGLVSVTDSNAVSVGRRFYRGVLLPSPGFELIPAGSFQMGDTFNEGVTNELPLHTAFVSAFYLERTEVTKGLWDYVYTWATNHGYEFDNVGLGKAADPPVHTINWYDAVKWCNARSEMEGLTPAYYLDTTFTTIYRTAQAELPTNFVRWNANGYRLPTEAEWEKAARGGVAGQRFPWGDTITHTQANYYSTINFVYDVSSTRAYHTDFKAGGFPYTNPADAFAPNAYGLFGMADNVSEWCFDWFDPDWYSKPVATQNDPRGPRGVPPLNYRVFRGGSWNVFADKVRSAYRGLNGPASATSSFGFRCVRGL